MVKDIRKLIYSILICELAGIIGSFFTATNWYGSLVKPSFNPPSWIFGPVWLILYFLMGISLYLVWTSKSKLKEDALKFFYIQLFFNALWSVLFFGLKNIFLSFLDITLLWIFIIVTMVKFYKISKESVYLLLAYFLWVSFASVLNFYILLLN